MSRNYSSRKHSNSSKREGTGKKIPTLKNAAECRNWLERDEERTHEVRRFDVWYAYLQRVSYGSTINKARPVLVISNDNVSRKANTVTVLPLTSNESRAEYAHNGKLSNIGDKYSESAVLCDQIVTIDKHQLNKKITHVSSREDQNKIEQSLMLYLGMA